MAMSPHNYYLATINRKIDLDGVPKKQPYQCVDLFKDFCKYQLGKTYNTICPDTGYARDIWHCFDKLGLGTYFEKVSANSLQDGDWAIWDFSKPCPYSHVAMFRKDNNNCTTGIFLGQNQAGKIQVTQASISYTGILGGLRPKVYKKNKPAQPSQPVKKDTRNFVNLPPSIDTWRFYDLNVDPIKKNAKGMLKPSKFGGLSYYVHEYRDDGATAVIETVQFGKVKIYIKGTCANISVGSYKYKNGNH